MTPDPPIPDQELFDFRTTRGFPRSYLDTYYAGDPSIDERIVSRFLAREGAVLSHGRYAEIGCGPTVHHIMPIAPHVAEIHLLDYLEENLALVRAWCEEVPGAHDWSRFTRMALADAGLPRDSAAVTQIVKSAIRGLPSSLTLSSCRMAADTAVSNAPRIKG